MPPPSDRAPMHPASDDDPLRHLSTEEIEEAAGELHRRIGVVLRGLGETGADRRAAPDGPPQAPASARVLVARLVVSHELAAVSLARLAEGDTGSMHGTAPRAPAALVAAVSYAAPTIPALLARLEQDRRLLVALGRRLDESGADGAAHMLLRAALVEASARCAQAVETLMDVLDA